MNVQEIITARLKSNYPWKLVTIQFFERTPIAVTGEVIMEGETLPACWIPKTGLCYMGTKEMPLHNLIPSS